MAGLGGVLGNQLAYRSARLSSSMPILNAVDCLVAIGCGFLIFHEVPHHSPTAVALEVLAFAALVAGLWMLSRIDAPGVQDADAHGLVGPGVVP
jgi:glucose uptake protein GlcU